ncbi:hypothetical protein ACR80S_03095 [Halomonas sp. MA07-2]|uniref:hypothetical protein n=1 Tax=unclassified Halomonas TaxID=2609666 RepID=UPI003EEC114B
MKINVEFDLTPDEFRQSLGLPDVAVFQQHLLGQIKEQMESGVEGYDPMSLMQPFLQQSGMGQGLTQGISQGLSQGLSSFGTYQQMMLDMLRQAGQSASQGGSDEARVSKSRSADSAGTSSKATGNGAAANKSTASARSRAKPKSE